MNSPLAGVMNAGFFLFGITAFVGAVMLRDLPGRRRVAVVVPAFLVAGGGVLLSLFHGTGEEPDSGAVDFHSIGALAAIVGGNALIIVLGRLYRQLGSTPKTGRAMVVLGVFGLVSLAGFLAIAGTDAGLIGLVERCAVYPTLIGLICAGRSLRRRTAPLVTADSAGGDSW